MHNLTDKIAHTTAGFLMILAEYWLVQGPPGGIDPMTHQTMCGDSTA